MKKTAAVVVVIIVVVLGIIFIPKLCHTCDDCEDFFVGRGYEPIAIAEWFTDEDEDYTICKDCAEKHHAIEILAGADVDDFKKDLFD